MVFVLGVGGWYGKIGQLNQPSNSDCFNLLQETRQSPSAVTAGLLLLASCKFMVSQRQGQATEKAARRLARLHGPQGQAKSHSQRHPRGNRRIHGQFNLKLDGRTHRRLEERGRCPRRRGERAQDSLQQSGFLQRPITMSA